MTMKEAGVGVVFCEMRVGWVLLLVKRFRLLLVLLRLRKFFLKLALNLLKIWASRSLLLKVTL